MLQMMPSKIQACLHQDEVLGSENIPVSNWEMGSSFMSGEKRIQLMPAVSGDTNPVFH